nr:sensor histidine kinase [Acuticoccus mangrovi]
MTATQSALRARLRQFRLRDQLEREQELRRELNHRVKNILSTVQAMARMTQRLGGSDGSRFNDFEARLGALSTVHAMLQDDRGEPATLRHVVSELIAPYANGEEGRVSVSAPTRPLDPEAAKTLALCLHELATNSAKYGAFSTEAGHVDIRLARDGEGWAFSWTESGGPPVTPPQRQGYGTRYLNGALQSLFGHSPDFDYAADGFRLRVGGAQPVLFAD